MYKVKEVLTSEYVFAHGKNPKGFGNWMFRLGVGLYFQSRTTYGEAKKFALKEANRLGVLYVKLCA